MAHTELKRAIVEDEKWVISCLFILLFDHSHCSAAKSVILCLRIERLNTAQGP
jgi:hypothetical protein